MKFLLKQTVRSHKKDGLVKVLPGVYNFIRIANKNKIPNQPIERIENNHVITIGYIFTKEDFSWLKILYKDFLEKKRSEFYSMDPLLQVIRILRYIFKRNNDAKNVCYYSNSLNAYDDKTTFLKLALAISNKIKYPFFKHGYQEDPLNSYHNIIYYFEIENMGQVSFHNSYLFEDVPAFSGEWIGIKNETFPFDLRKVKSLLPKNKDLSS